MKLGFIGTGAITEHVVTGLIQQAGFEDPILVSERSHTRSSRLASKFKNVFVNSDNQPIVDEVDFLFVATLPQQTLDVLKSLRFRDDQTIVSLAAGLSVEQLSQVVSPASKINRIIPMPPNEIGVGPIPVYPPSNEVESLLSGIGTIIPVDDEQHFSSFSASSAVMATFFELVAANAKWIESTGAPPEMAARYSASLFHALATQIKDFGAEELSSVSAKSQTPGGLNEQLLIMARRNGWFDELNRELDLILERIV